MSWHRSSRYYDETQPNCVTSFALSEHPNLKEVTATGQAICRPVVAGEAGPALQTLLASIDGAHEAYIPVGYDGQIDGVVAVLVRGQAGLSEIFDYAKAVGHLIEPADSNGPNS